ncbi:TerD family protein [Candidatus Epulonipiscium viviparus]|uniref:TerD family protein n=1 Tax=Candidatus Epulonipiscium viviparus TaxID=420336 RepID=UPI00016BFC81|nr:TerD family protein [Candidatus Epulopiscium viviparus]
MAVNLKKGDQVELAKSKSNSKILVGLSWDLSPQNDYIDFDLDTSIFLVGRNGKVTKESDFIFYDNLIHDSGAIEHTGDNQTGEGDGDNEVIRIDLDLIPADINKIIFVVTIYDADNREQNFGQMENASIRIIDEETGEEKIHFDLCEDFSIETALVVAEIYRYNNEWNFAAIGSGYSGGLHVLCQVYGLDIATALHAQ